MRLLTLASVGGALAPPRGLPAAVWPRVFATTGGHPMNDFSSGLERLENVIGEACSRQEEWPARVAAGIRAALDFAVTEPDAARTLAIEVRATDFEGDYLSMIEQLSQRLAAEAPPEQDLSVSTDQALVGGIATVVADHLRAGREAELIRVAPELVYLTLLPYVGFDEAKRWSDSVAPI